MKIRVSKYVPGVLKRRWPATSKHEVSGLPDKPLQAPETTPLENLHEEERKLLQRLIDHSLLGSGTTPVIDDLWGEWERARETLRRSHV